MALVLRPAQLTDLPSIYRGEQDYIRTWEADHEAVWYMGLERHLTRWVEHFEGFTIAMLDAQFAGYSLWLPEQGCADLCTLNVSPAHRRAGIGRALLEVYMADATCLGFTRLTLSVRPDNPARGLYQQAGFVHVGGDKHGYLRYERRS